MRIVFLLILLLFFAGCSSDAGDSNALPTVMEFPTETETTSVTASYTPTLIEEATIAPTDSPSATATLTLTLTSEQSVEITNTQIPPTSTPLVIQQLPTPVISTLTPIPIGSDIIPPPIPLVAADIVVTEFQFQSEITRLAANVPEIETISINFVSGEVPGVAVRMTALGGQAWVSGDVFVAFELMGDLVAISIVDVSIGGQAAPQGFVEVAQDEMFTLMIDTLDAVLAQHIGPDHDLQSLRMTDNTMEIMLLIPE